MENIIITSGGTLEPIDNIRNITNISTGRLALSLIIRLCQIFPETNFYYIASGNAMKPNILIPNIKVIIIRTAEDLSKTILALKDLKPKAIIHSMAVSDFRPEKSPGKISSKKENLIIELKSNPKIIDIIRKQFPQALLFAFKLESEIKKELLFQRGKDLMKRVKADYVIMNLAEDISLFFHKGFIMDKEKNIRTFYSKSDCSLIIANILKGI